MPPFSDGLVINMLKLFTVNLDQFQRPPLRPPRVNCISGSSHISPPSCIKNTFLQLVLLWFILYTLGNEWGGVMEVKQTVVTLWSPSPQLPGGPLRALIHPCVCGPPIGQRLACSPLDFRMIFLSDTLSGIYEQREKNWDLGREREGEQHMWDSSRVYIVFC